jgi:hypothetical protein
MTHSVSKMSEDDIEDNISKNPERRDTKKLTRLLKKEHKTREDLQKIGILQSKIKYYKSRNTPQRKKEPSIISSDDFLEQEFQKNNVFWKEENERVKREEEQRAQRREEEQQAQRRDEEQRAQRREEEQQAQRREEEQKEQWYYKMKVPHNPITEMLYESNVDIPQDITKYMNQPYDKKAYYQLVRKYHPDKKACDDDICTLFTQLINTHKPEINNGIDETWQK